MSMHVCCGSRDSAVQVVSQEIERRGTEETVEELTSIPFLYLFPTFFPSTRSIAQRERGSGLRSYPTNLFYTLRDVVQSLNQPAIPED